jgi:N-acetylglucosamine-6-phosphate deacetylase
MAAAGSDEQVFAIGGRRVTRKDGTLRLDDGTLAGADLTLPRAVQVMVQQVGLPLAQALAMATRTPATVIRRPDLGHLQPGAVADMVHLSVDLTLTGVWRAAQRVA